MKVSQKDDGYIRFRCSVCGKRLKVRDTFEGGVVIPCPNCQASVVTPMANLEKIASPPGNDEEDEWVQRMSISPGRLRSSLSGAGPRNGSTADNAGTAPAAGPVGNAGATGTRGGDGQKRWMMDAARGVPELEQTGAAIAKIDATFIRRVQKLCREEDLTPVVRARRIEELSVQRRHKLEEVFKKKLATMRGDLAPLQSNRDDLDSKDAFRFKALTLALDVVLNYGRYMYGLNI